MLLSQSLQLLTKLPSYTFYLVTLCSCLISLVALRSLMKQPLNSFTKINFQTLGLDWGRGRSFLEEKPILQSIDSLLNYYDVEYGPTDLFYATDAFFKYHREGTPSWFKSAFNSFYRMAFLPTKCESVNVHKLVNATITPAHAQNFTVVINTWRRNRCLIKTIKHFNQCTKVAQIRIVWSDPELRITPQLYGIASEINNQSQYKRVAFDGYHDDKLTNRFIDRSEFITDGIFSVDDDGLLYSCELLHNTFSFWSTAPNYMIGYAPRIPKKPYQHAPYKIDSRLKKLYEPHHAFQQCQYSIIFPTLGSFMHRKYFQLYHDDAFAKVRALVDDQITAEDISMSLMYSWHSGYPPITVLIPEHEYDIGDFLQCQDKDVDKPAWVETDRMHTNKDAKRMKVFLETMHHFGDSLDLKISTLWVDVMPHPRDHKLYAWLT